MLVKFANAQCVVEGGKFAQQDIWVDDDRGLIVDGQDAFYSPGQQRAAEEVVDLSGCILSPGFLDVQLNGAMGFDFSAMPTSADEYERGIAHVSEYLVQSGVTAYLPTITTQSSELYHTALPVFSRYCAKQAHGSAAVLGVHAEGPFISLEKNGIHSRKKIRDVDDGGIATMEECYGKGNMQRGGPIRKVTAAPEKLIDHPGTIEALRERNIVYSIGHTSATYEQAMWAVEHGATMITHLFNAMNPMHHRNPGVLGLLGNASLVQKVYFGIIADNFHVHPSCVSMAHHANPRGTILVTDAMTMLGLPPGTYDWTNGEKIIKDEHGHLILAGQGNIAGSAVTLDTCIRNFAAWTGAGLACALACVTEHPARMLGEYPARGSLRPGSRADMVVLDPDGYVRAVYLAGRRITPRTMHMWHGQESTSTASPRGPRRDL